MAALLMDGLQLFVARGSLIFFFGTGLVLILIGMINLKNKNKTMANFGNILIGSILLIVTYLLLKLLN